MTLEYAPTRTVNCLLIKTKCEAHYIPCFSSLFLILSSSYRVPRMDEQNEEYHKMQDKQVLKANNSRVSV